MKRGTQIGRSFTLVRVQQLLWFSMHLNGLLLVARCFIVFYLVIDSMRMNILSDSFQQWTMSEECICLWTQALVCWCVNRILLIKMLYNLWPCDNWQMKTIQFVHIWIWIHMPAITSKCQNLIPFSHSTNLLFAIHFIFYLIFYTFYTKWSWFYSTELIF